MLGVPALGRPQILTGTFNKILSYPTGVYADQHFRFHEAMKLTDRVLVIGYGFRDKAINARIVAWAEQSGTHRLVVAHEDPGALAESARRAIRGKGRSGVRSSSFHLPVIAHIEHGYRWLEIVSRVGCSVTTVHRRVRACGDGGRNSPALAAGETKKT